MVKPNTIGMIEKYANVVSGVAGEDLFNGALVAESNGKFVKSATATHVAGYIKAGDELYTDFVIKSGVQHDFSKLSDWVGRELVVSPENVAYATSENYASITEGTTLMKSDANGKFAIIATAPTATGAVYFKATKKVEFDGKGVKVQILVK